MEYFKASDNASEKVKKHISTLVDYMNPNIEEPSDQYTGYGIPLTDEEKKEVVSEICRLLNLDEGKVMQIREALNEFDNDYADWGFLLIFDKYQDHEKINALIKETFVGDLEQFIGEYCDMYHYEMGMEDDYADKLIVAIELGDIDNNTPQAQAVTLLEELFFLDV